MTPDLIEIVNPLGADDPLHRMKHRAMARYLDGLSFEHARPDLPRTPLAVVVRADLRDDPPGPIADHLRRRHRDTVVMMHIPDFLQHHPRALAVFDEFIDVYMVPTPELRDILSAFTRRDVDVLPDPIDFLLTEPRPNPERQVSGPLRLMWFGYPESFEKSMKGYMPALRGLVQAGEVELHVVTRQKEYGQRSFFTVHRYDPRTFQSLALTFDACVLSHQPFDFSVSTWVKSENKAVLAIALGLPVVASRTPAYARLLQACGLGEFLFASQDELVATVRRLADPHCRRRFLQASQPWVMEHYSPRRNALEWQRLMLQARRRKFGEADDRVRP